MPEYFDTSSAEVGLEQVWEMFILAPLENPDIIPAVLPLVLGLIVIELYFGKHSNEDLGWNTSVGNSVIWVTTGISLYITESLSTQELHATMALIGLGLVIGYMNFFHKWSPAVAFAVSSAGVIYTLAYILVIIVKTDLPMNQSTFEASGIFFIATIIVFKIIKAMEVEQKDPYSIN